MAKSDERRVAEAFDRDGIVLLTDPQFPSITTVVARQPVKGSWWAHSAAHAIFHAANALAERPDVLVCRLLSRKVTFVHRRWWAALLGVARAREEWAMAGLSSRAKSLLDRVDVEGEQEATGTEVRTLEDRLLIYAEQVHQKDSGAHAKVLFSWNRWMLDRGWNDKLIAPEIGRSRLDEAIAEMNRSHDAHASLPWQRRGRARQI
jgi:hypothetical protein